MPDRRHRKTLQAGGLAGLGGIIAGALYDTVHAINKFRSRRKLRRQLAAQDAKRQARRMRRAARAAKDETTGSG